MKQYAIKFLFLCFCAALMFSCSSSRKTGSGGVYDALKARESDAPRYLTYYNLAAAYSVMSETDRAIEALENAIVYGFSDFVRMAEDPSFKNLHATAWWFNFGADFGNRVIDIITKAIRRDPQNVVAYNSRGDIYTYFFEDYDKAIKDFNTALKIDSAAHFLYAGRANVYSYIGKHERALRDYDAAIRLAPDVAHYYWRRGILHTEAESYDLAMTDFTNSIQLDSADYSPFFYRGALYVYMEEYESAIADFNMALERSPDNAYIYIYRGLAYAYQNNHGAAIENYNRAIELLPYEADAYIYRGHVYGEMGEYGLAVGDYTRAINISPDNYMIYAFRAEEYFNNMGEFDLALEDLNRAIELNQNFAAALRDRGMVYLVKGELDRAMEDMTTAVQMDQSLVDGLIAILIERREFDLALDFATKAISLDTANLTLYNLRGNVYVYRGEYEKAIEDFTVIITRDQGFTGAGAYNNRSSVYGLIGDYDRAIEDLTRALEFFELNEGEIDRRLRAMMYNNRGYIFMLQENYERALSDFSEAIRFDPNNFVVYDNIAETYVNIGNFEKALENIELSLRTAETSSNLNSIFAFATFYAAQVYGLAPFLNADSITAEMKPYVQLVRDGLSRSIGRAEQVRSAMGSRGAAIMTQALYLYYMGVDFEVQTGSIEKAFEYSESLRSRGFLEQMGTDAALRLPEITFEERENITGLLRQIERQQSVFDAFRRNPPGNREEAERYIAAGQNLNRLENELIAADAAVFARLSLIDENLAMRYGELRNPKPKTLAEAQAWAGSDRAVLEFVLWDNTNEYKPIKRSGHISERDEVIDSRPAINSYVLVITQDTAVAVLLDSDFDYAGAVNRIREQITLERNRMPSRIPDAVARMENDRNALYNALIKPALPHIPDHIKNLVIVPDGVLGLLPFDILRESADGRDIGETYRITISPSLSVSMLRSENTARRFPILAFGGAWYERDRDRAPTLASTARGRAMPTSSLVVDGAWGDLKNSDREVENLSRIVPNPQDITVILGRDVSEENVKRLSAQGELARHPILHFAVHGHFSKDDIGQASLVFSEVSGHLDNGEDGYLTMPEIAALDLDARMVMLSACHSGEFESRRGDGMVGLTRAFMITGVDNVGVSLWAIDDEATMEFMTRMYTKVLIGGLTFSESYYQVKNEFRRHENVRWRFPFFWAPLVIYE